MHTLAYRGRHQRPGKAGSAVPLVGAALRELRPNGSLASLTSRGLGCLISHASLLARARHAVPLHQTPSFLTPHFSSWATTRVAPTPSLLTPHSYDLTPKTSLLKPHPKVMRWYRPPGRRATVFWSSRVISWESKSCVGRPVRACRVSRLAGSWPRACNREGSVALLESGESGKAAVPGGGVSGGVGVEVSAVAAFHCSSSSTSCALSPQASPKGDALVQAAGQAGYCVLEFQGH